MAAQAAGGVIQSVAANMAAKAMRDETAREIRRQTKYRNQAFGVVQDALPTQGAEEAKRSLAANQQNREAKYESAGQANFGQGSNGPTARDQVAIDLAGSARARLGAYSDWQLEQMIKRLRTQERLNKISSFSEGTAQMFGSRLSDAQHSADELGAFGAFLSSAAGAGSNMAAYGGRSQGEVQSAQGVKGGYDYTPRNENDSMWS